MFLSEVQSGIARQFYWPDDYLQVFIESFDGMRWVQLDRNGCIREGALMKHCVGSEPYLSEVDANLCHLFSLRDRANRPHCTVEFSHRGLQLEQAKGKANSSPIKYRVHLMEFLNRKYLIDRFDLSPQGVYDLLGAKICLDKDRFIPLEQSRSPSTVADMFMKAVSLG